MLQSLALGSTLLPTRRIARVFVLLPSFRNTCIPRNREIGYSSTRFDSKCRALPSRNSISRSKITRSRNPNYTIGGKFDLWPSFTREIFEDRLRRVSGSGIQRVGGKSARGLSEIEQEGQASSSKA